jgi:mRNA interferase YafQ
LKKTPASKRTSPPRRADYTESFAKDLAKNRERLSRSGRYDMTRLKEVMLLLFAADTPSAPNDATTPSKANDP